MLKSRVPHRRSNCLSLVLLGLFLALAADGSPLPAAAAGPPAAGHWDGAIELPGQKLAIDVDLRLEEGVSRAARARAILEPIGALIEPALTDWKTPGLALGVVVEGEVVLARGFGKRDLENGLPVTADTLFAIGSTTKAFTTFLMGLLVDAGKLDWDAPVARYLPDFKLQDEYATAHLTPRDMVSHRSGLPRHDLTWYNNESLTRAELVRRLRHLPPNKELREIWQYNNLMFLTAGYLVEQLTGRTWEEEVVERIFKPLGMRRSNFSVADSQADVDHALPYIVDNDELRQVAFRPITLMGPAGSINSCVNDMVRWLQLHLGEGQVAGAALISAGTLAELHAPQMVIPGIPEEREQAPGSYALGWFTTGWQGHRGVFHGGNFGGFSALVTLLPDDGLGMVVLANRRHTPLPGLLTRTVADLILELPPRDWIGEAAGRRERARDFQKKGQEDKSRFRVQGTEPSRRLAAFAGDYHHPGYGDLEIRAEDDGLTLVYNGMVMPLEHWHYDVFNVAESDQEIIPENLKVNFFTDERGRLSRLSVGLEPQVDPMVFRRKPAHRLSDPAYLERLAGDYQVPDQTLTFSVKGTRLVLQIPGQPAQELIPAGENEFDIKGLSGFSIRFTVPEHGPASEAVFIQPDGVFPAAREGDLGAD